MWLRVASCGWALVGCNSGPAILSWRFGGSEWGRWQDDTSLETNMTNGKQLHSYIIEKMYWTPSKICDFPLPCSFSRVWLTGDLWCCFLGDLVAQPKGFVTRCPRCLCLMRFLAKVRCCMVAYLCVNLCAWVVQLLVWTCIYIYRTE